MKQKHKRNRMTAGLAALLFLVGLSACGNSPAQESPAPAPSDTQTAAPQEPPADPAAEDAALGQIRETLTQQDALCGIAYLGETAPDGSVTELLQNYEEFPFLQTIPQDRTLVRPGQEVYCLVPQSGITLTVQAWTPEAGDYVRGQVGETLYETEDSQPLLLIGNETGLPNFAVTAQGPEETSFYSPYLHPCVGVVDVPEDGAFYEFAQALPPEAGANSEAFAGTWTNGSITLSFQTDGTMTLDREGMDPLTGTFYVADTGNISFELDDAQGPAFWGIYTLTPHDGASLTVTHIDGDPLTPDGADTSLELQPG